MGELLPGTEKVKGDFEAGAGPILIIVEGGNRKRYSFSEPINNRQFKASRPAGPGNG
jgi:hypothetical protein